MQLTTTLRLLRRSQACADRYNHLVSQLGPDWVDDRPIPLVIILTLNGLYDAVWALRAVPAEQVGWAKRIARLFAADCAEAVAWVWDLYGPPEIEWHPRDCIRVARAFAVGQATVGDLVAAKSDASAAAWAADMTTASAVWAPARAARTTATAAMGTARAGWAAISLTMAAISGAVSAAARNASAASVALETAKKEQTKNLLTYLEMGGRLNRNPRTIYVRPGYFGG